MKKRLSKLKLTQFNKAEMEERQMNVLKGGGGCACSAHCGCLYYGHQEGPMTAIMKGLQLKIMRTQMHIKPLMAYWMVYYMRLV